MGPSIASGSQVCNPNCADLPATPKSKKKEIMSASLNVKLKNVTFKFKVCGARAEIDKKSTVPKKKNSKKIPTERPRSPTRFITIAFKADLLA